MEEKRLLDGLDEESEEEVNDKTEEVNHLPAEAVEHQDLQLGRVTKETEFSKTLDKGNINIVTEAAANDTKFVDDLKKELKEAALKNAENEREKQELEKQNVKYAQELLETQQNLNKLKQVEDKWENKQKRRQFHYDGVKPVMEWVGIKTPMNLILLYFLTFILIVPYLIGKFVKGTIGNLICGAEDTNRSKAMRGFLWTILAITITALIGLGFYALGHYVFLWF